MSETTKKPPADKSQEPMPWVEAKRTSRNPADVKSSFTPIMRLAAEHQRATLAYAVALAVSMFSTFVVWRAVKDARAPQTTFAIDGSGTVHIGPLEGLNPDATLFKEAGLLMAQTHMLRTPDGLAQPELAHQLYTDEAYKQLKQEVDDDAPLFKSRNYFQQPTIMFVEPVEWGIGGKPRCRVKGFIMRNGVIDQLAQRDGPFYFRITYELVANPRVGDRGQYPYKVARYRLTWTDGRYEPLPENAPR